MKRSDAAIGDMYYVRNLIHLDIIISTNCSIGFNAGYQCDCNQLHGEHEWEWLYKGWKKLYD